MSERRASRGPIFSTDQDAEPASDATWLYEPSLEPPLPKAPTKGLLRLSLSCLLSVRHALKPWASKLRFKYVWTIVVPNHFSGPHPVRVIIARHLQFPLIMGELQSSSCNRSHCVPQLGLASALVLATCINKAWGQYCFRLQLERCWRKPSHGLACPHHLTDKAFTVNADKTTVGFAEGPWVHSLSGDRMRPTALGSRTLQPMLCLWGARG